MTQYVAKLKVGEEEILTEEEIGEYLHFFTKDEIEYIKEIPE
jgi:hypothetical protein